jgi:hypothetical protein
MSRTRYHWCWTSGLLTTELGVVPTLLSTGNIVLTTTTVTDRRVWYHLYLPIASTSGRLHSEFVRLLFLQDHRETDRFLPVSGVQFAQTDRDQFHFRRAAFSSMLKSRVGNILVKESALRINLNLDGEPIASKSHTHPSHSQSSRLLTSSLSLGVSVPRPTQCMRGA